MPTDKALPLDGIHEAPQFTESLTAVRPDIQTQLSIPKDISAASNFFKPQGAESFLPSMSAPTGLEATAMAPPPGLEAGLGMPMPGAEQMSPLINMIMKMPGGIGLASSFFEFLGSFFGGPDMMGMVDGLTDGIQGMVDGIGEHLGLDLDLMADGGDDGLLSTLGDGAEIDVVRSNNALSFNSSEPLEVSGDSLESSFANARDLNVGGEGNSFGKPMFEQGGQLNFAPGKSFGENDLLAVDPNGSSFGSTVGPATSGQMPASNLNLNSIQGGQDFGRPSGFDAAAGDNVGGDPSTVNGTATDATNAATDGSQAAGSDAPAENATYTVKEGDNLWDIAGKHLGDSAKWGELYKLNEGVIGANPSLIMPGTELQLPGGADHLASAADYTVKPGDNLWDIAKDNLGGGEHWKELFHNNADVVGQNPDLIHPGQHLSMSGAEHGGGSHLADSHAGTAHGASHAAHHNTSSISHNGAHHVSHAAPAHHPHVAHAAPSHTAHTASASGVNHAAASAKGLPVELKAQAQSLPGIETYDQGSGT